MIILQTVSYAWISTINSDISILPKFILTHLTKPFNLISSYVLIIRTGSGSHSHSDYEDVDEDAYGDKDEDTDKADYAY